jgi:predicted MFS family arabinose efflux permease
MTANKLGKTAVPMRILLFGVLLSHLGTYMVVPLLPIFLKVQKGMTVPEIGLILAVSPFTYQAGSLLGGWLADRIGRRYIIALGAWINAIAIAGFAIFNSLWLFIGMGLVSGLGVGLNAPSTKAAIAALASENSNKTTAFSLRGIAANIGTAIAGLLTYFILGGASSLIFYVAAGMYVLLGVVTWSFLPKGCGDEPCQIVPLSSYFEVFRNKAFVLFSLVSILIWALYTQLSLSLPLRAETILADPGVVSLIWTVNSVIVIVLQTPISRWFIEKTHPMSALSLGILFVGAGLATVYWSSSFYGLMLSGIIFIIGEMLIVPTMDTTVSQLGAARIIGVFFGIANFISGIGEGAGKYLGGQLLSLGTQSFVPSVIYGAAAMIISGILIIMRFMQPLRSTLGKQLNGSASLAKRTYSGEEPYPTFIDWFLGRKKRTK